MASSQDSNPPPNSPFGGVDVPPSADFGNVHSEFRQGRLYAPNTDNVGSPYPYGTGNAPFIPRLNQNQHDARSRGVPDVVAAAAYQQQITSVGRFVEHLGQNVSEHGPLRQVMTGFHALAAQNPVGGLSNAMNLKPGGGTVGPYGSYGEALNTAALFVHPAFQGQVAGQYADERMRQIGNIAAASSGGFIQPQDYVNAYRQVQAHNRSGIGMRVDLQHSDLQGVNDPQSYIHSMIQNTALQDIRATTAPLERQFNTLPVGIRREVMGNIRQVTTSEIGAARGLERAILGGAMGGVPLDRSVSYNDVMAGLGETNESLFEESMFVTNPMAADPFRFVTSGSRRNSIDRATQAADQQAFVAHAAYGGPQISPEQYSDHVNSDNRGFNGGVGGVGGGSGGGGGGNFGGGSDDDGGGFDASKFAAAAAGFAQAMEVLTQSANKASAALGGVPGGGTGGAGGAGGTSGVEQGFAPTGSFRPQVTDEATARSFMGLPPPRITDPSRLIGSDGQPIPEEEGTGVDARGELYIKNLKGGFGSAFSFLKRKPAAAPLTPEQEEAQRVQQTQARADLAHQIGRRGGMGLLGAGAGVVGGVGLGLMTGGIGTLAMLGAGAGGGAGLLGRQALGHIGNIGGGFVGGFLGRSSTANDTRGRRVAAGLGAATRFIGGSMTGVFKEPGVDMMSFFGQIPFGTRGLQGFTLLESLQNIAAPGELPALQASSLLGQGYSDVGLMGAMGGQLGQFADSLGMDRAMAAQMLMPLASGASNTIGSGAGRVSLQEIAAMTQAGMDVGGLLGNASSFGFQTGSTPSFAISNMAFNLGARGQQRTALTAQMQGMTQGFAAQNLVYGDDRSRARYLSRIYTMGQGNMSTGQAVFGRGAAVAERAKGSLASDYAGVAQSVLMAHAMRQSGGNRLQALNFLENLQAQGGQAMLGILQQNGLDRETALMSLRAEGLSARDIIDIQAGNAGDSRFQVSGAAPSRITPATDAATALPTVSLKARESNRRIGLNYDNMDLSMQKAEYDQRSEEYFLEKARSAGDGLADLEKSLREFNSLMDDFIINQRQNFGSNLKTAMDPNADILPRIGAVLGSALYFGIAGFLEKNIGR